MAFDSCLLYSGLGDLGDLAGLVLTPCLLFFFRGILMFLDILLRSKIRSKATSTPVTPSCAQMPEKGVLVAMKAS